MNALITVFTVLSAFCVLLLVFLLFSIFMSGCKEPWPMYSAQVLDLPTCPDGAVCFKCENDFDTWYEVGGCHEDPTQRHYVVKK